jgi:L-fuculose-phosphate aldolase
VNERALREALVEIGRRCYARGYISAYDGNFSARLDRERLLVTPAGVCKGYLATEQMVRTDLHGRPERGQGRVSSEVKMHVAIYEERPDVGAVVHGHPPTATGFAVANVALDRPALAEVIVALGCIPLAEYGTPSTEELPNALRPWIRRHDALLMANHGALAVGADLDEAYFRMETVEHFARISLTAHLLGGIHELPAHKVAELLAIRRRIGLPPPQPDCPRCEALGGAGAGAVDESLVELIADAVGALAGKVRSS